MDDASNEQAASAHRLPSAKASKLFTLSLVVVIAHLSFVLVLGTDAPYLIARGVSMEPTYHEGDLLIARSIAPSEIRVGDVIAFRVPTEARAKNQLPSNVAHRVTKIRSSGGQLWFSTRGDNTIDDPFDVPSDAVFGKVAFNAGPIAWPITKLFSRTVLLILGIPALTFVLAFGSVLLWGRRSGTGSRETTFAMLQRWVAQVRLSQPPQGVSPHRSID